MLREVNGGTELVFTHAQLPDDVARDAHEEGWIGALDKLEAVFARSPEPGRAPRFTGRDGA